MASVTNFLFIFFSVSSYLWISSHADPTPTPAIWPPQFHSFILMSDTNGTVQEVDLWYDWPNGRNFNIIKYQSGKVLYDLEWNNGTSFYYTLDANKECFILTFEFGLLPPNWLQGGLYVGQTTKDGVLCNVWSKADFIVYYEDVNTKTPVHWDFYTGMSASIKTFEVGAVLEDAKWQAPDYCFQKAVQSSPGLQSTAVDLDSSLGGLMKAILNTAGHV